MEIDRSWLRIMGLAGVLGGLALFAGDMLFYYSSAGTDLQLNMGGASDARIIASGVAGLVGTWLYVVGAGQVFQAFKTTTALARNTVTACFVAIFIAYGIVHGAYIAIATSARLSVGYQIDMETATALAVQANNTLRLLIYPIFALLSYVFITRVWSRKTLYPRWMILFFPLIPFLFQGLISRSLSGSVWIVIVGGFFNLILVVFFAASTIALWGPGPDSTG